MAILLAALWPGRRKPAPAREEWTPLGPHNGEVVWSGRGNQTGPPVVYLSRRPHEAAPAAEGERQTPQRKA